MQRLIALIAAVLLAGMKQLQSLELDGCEFITGEGLQVVSNFPCLRVLSLNRCNGLSRGGLCAVRGEPISSMNFLQPARPLCPLCRL